MIQNNKSLENEKICCFQLLDRVPVELVQGKLENEETDVIINLTDP